jgi:hypothetical protein
VVQVDEVAAGDLNLDLVMAFRRVGGLSFVLLTLLAFHSQHLRDLLALYDRGCKDRLS